MTSIAVVRDVFDALGRMIVSTPMFIDDSQLATYELYGWRLPFGAPAAPLEANQIPTITMSPGDVRPWTLNWSQWLGTGGTIATSTWFPVAGLTLSNEASTPTSTSLWITAGTTEQTCLLTNRITSSDGRADEQSVTVIIQQR